MQSGGLWSHDAGHMRERKARLLFFFPLLPILTAFFALVDSIQQGDTEKERDREGIRDEGQQQSSSRI